MSKDVQVLFIDNFDSFSFNLVDELERRSAQVSVWRNGVDAAAVLTQFKRAAGDAPKLIVLSPGPGSPAEAGCCASLMRLASAEIPVLGICLGHQVIVEAFGGRVVRAPAPMHGKTSKIRHDGQALFEGLDPAQPLVVGRYHSLCAKASQLPEALIAQACVVGPGADEDVVMALRHRQLPIYGLQFHPESLLTREGGSLIEGALRMARAFCAQHEEERR